MRFDLAANCCYGAALLTSVQNRMLHAWVWAVCVPNKQTRVFIKEGKLVTDMTLQTWQPQSQPRPKEALF